MRGVLWAKGRRVAGRRWVEWVPFCALCVCVTVQYMCAATVKPSFKRSAALS